MTNANIKDWLNENLRDIVYDAIQSTVDIDSITDVVVSEIESSDIVDVNAGNPEDDALIADLLRRIMHATDDCGYFETATRMLELRKFAKDTIANR